MGLYLPYVIERNSQGERSYDLYSRMLKDRIVFLNTEIESNLASSVVAQLLFLDSQGHEDINLYISSGGGSISSGLAIYDVMQYIKSDVSTICIGMAASMAAVLLAAGTKGKRYCLTNAEVMIHEPRIMGNGLSGQAIDIDIYTKNLLKTKERMNKILAKHTGKTIQEIEKDTERDNYMNAEEAVAYGIVDEIIEKKV